MYQAIGSIYAAVAVEKSPKKGQETTGYVLVDPKGKKYDYMDSIYGDIPKYTSGSHVG